MRNKINKIKGFTMRRMRHGFTLIEVLVVIAIIGELATITLVGYQRIRKRGEDVRRKTELASIANALEGYGLDNDYKFPPAPTGELLGKNTSSKVDEALVPSYFEMMPVDEGWPATAPDFWYFYRYKSTNAGKGFQLQAKLAGGSDTYFTITHEVNGDSYTSSEISTPLVVAPDTTPPTWFYSPPSLAIEAVDSPITTVNLNWSGAVDVSSPVKYTIKYGTATNPSTVGCNDVTTTSCNITKALGFSGIYYFKLSVADVVGNTGTVTTEKSIDLSASTALIWKKTDTPPLASEFKATPGTNKVVVSWKYITVQPQIDSYVVEYKLNTQSGWTSVTAVNIWDGTLIRNSSGSTTLSLYKNNPGETYQFKVKAINKQGLATYYPDDLQNPDPDNPKVLETAVVNGVSSGDITAPIWPANAADDIELQWQMIGGKKALDVSFDPATDPEPNDPITYILQIVSTSNPLVPILTENETNGNHHVFLDLSLLVSGGQYFVHIIAKDAAGNQSNFIESQTFAYTP